MNQFFIHNIYAKKIQVIGDFHKNVPLPHKRDKETLISFIGEPFFFEMHNDYEYCFYVNRNNIYLYILYKQQIIKTKLILIK